MSKDASNPTAFLSYARFNDQHDGGELSNFSVKLAGKIQTVTRAPFKIFQDRRDIQVGQNWLARIRGRMAPSGARPSTGPEEIA